MSILDQRVFRPLSSLQVNFPEVCCVQLQVNFPEAKKGSLDPFSGRWKICHRPIKVSLDTLISHRRTFMSIYPVPSSTSGTVQGTGFRR